MREYMLTDSQWEKLYDLMLSTGRVYAKYEHRLTLEGILYRLRVGCPWRDIPAFYGDWSQIYRRFSRWSQKGVLRMLLERLIEVVGKTHHFIDGSIVKAHQHSAGAATLSDEAIGKSRGGLSTKIHLATDETGRPVVVGITGGQVNDIALAEELIERLPTTELVVADKGYDSEALRDAIEDKGAKAVIPRRVNLAYERVTLDKRAYKSRHIVENAFARLKHYRAIATRYDKLARNYYSLLSLGCAMIWLRDFI